MKRISLFVLGTCFMLLLGSALGHGADDKIADDLEKAKTKFETDSKKLRADIQDDFDKRLTRARDKGDKKTVEKIKDEQRVFELHRILASTANKDFRNRAASQGKAIEKVYTEAKKAYFKAKKDDLATAIDKEWKRFQNEELITLASSERPELWFPLFNGKDLAGWDDGNSVGAWKVVDGALQGENKKNGDLKYLTSVKAEYDNFHLRMEVMFSPGCSSGLVFRRIYPVQSYWTTLTSEKADKWNEVVFTGGKLKTISQMPQGTVPPANQWYTFELIARGDSIITMINGEKMADVVNENEKKVAIEKGAFLIEVAGGGQNIRIRKIELLPLPSPLPEKK